MQEQLRRTGPPRPQRIGIDEIAIGRHHQYRFVVNDLDAGRPIWFGGSDRSVNTIDQEIFNAAFGQRSGQSGYLPYWTSMAWPRRQR